MWRKAQTFVVVTLVTVLIWVWADAETQRSDLIGPGGGSGGAVMVESEGVVQTVPVRIALPAGAGGAGSSEELSARAEPLVLKRVRVRGPAGVVSRAAGNESAVVAVVVLDERDVRDGVDVVVRQAVLWCDGVALTAVGDDATVRVVLTRSAPAPTPPGTR